MRRREFVALLGTALVLPSKPQAQSRPRIAILHSGYPNRTPIHLLFASLERLGYTKDATATIELLGGEGDAQRLNALVLHLAADKPDVIIAITSPAALAIKRAGLNVPVAFAFVNDALGIGLVDNLAHPGGNFTWVTFSEAVIGGKRLDLLLEVIPRLKNLAVMFGRGLPENTGIFDSISNAGRDRGLKIEALNLSDIGDLKPAFNTARMSGAEAVIFMTDNVMFGHRNQVAELAIYHGLPSMHAFSAEVQDGGLMSYSPSMAENYERAAAIADRIIKGARPADLPVEQPTRFELFVNLKTAKALGVIIPESLLLRADEVIE